MKIAQSAVKQRMKDKYLTIGKRNVILKNIYTLVSSSHSFILTGHVLPDEDCYASLTACALLLSKFQKKTTIFFSEPFPERLGFLSAICQYNNIPVYCRNMPDIAPPDAICIFDTPKPSLVAVDGCLKRYIKNSSIPKIELDHHFSSDAAFCGEPEHSLVMHASSTCEILCLICYKLLKHPEILARYHINELFSRNLVLTLLTGMLGDAKTGDFLHKKCDKKSFEYFSNYLNLILKQKTVLGYNSKNIDSIEVLLEILQSSTEEDRQLYKIFMANRSYDRKIGRVVLSEAESAMLLSMAELSQLIDIIKTATNDLADAKNGVGISTFYDYTVKPVQVQCRIRASAAAKGINLHKVIEHFNITEGGGHPGAIAFRIQPKTYRELILFIVEATVFIENELLS